MKPINLYRYIIFGVFTICICSCSSEGDTDNRVVSNAGDTLKKDSTESGIAQPPDSLVVLFSFSVADLDSIGTLLTAKEVKRRFDSQVPGGSEADYYIKLYLTLDSLRKQGIAHEIYEQMKIWTIGKPLKEGSISMQRWGLFYKTFDACPYAEGKLGLLTGYDSDTGKQLFTLITSRATSGADAPMSSSTTQESVLYKNLTLKGWSVDSTEESDDDIVDIEERKYRRTIEANGMVSKEDVKERKVYRKKIKR